jgi:hypothetical protein
MTTTITGKTRRLPDRPRGRRRPRSLVVNKSTTKDDHDDEAIAAPSLRSCSCSSLLLRHQQTEDDHDNEDEHGASPYPG